MPIQADLSALDPERAARITGHALRIARGLASTTLRRGKRRRWLELSGKRIGKLRVIRKANEYRKGRSAETWWLCRCQCGSQFAARQYSVLNGSPDCGCVGHRRIKHGLCPRRDGVRYRTPEYNLWLRLRAVAKRGTVVYGPWRADVAAFTRDVGAQPAPGWSLVRVVSPTGFVPGNVMWVSPQQKMPWVHAKLHASRAA